MGDGRQLAMGLIHHIYRIVTQGGSDVLPCSLYIYIMLRPESMYAGLLPYSACWGCYATTWSHSTAAPVWWLIAVQ